MSIFDIAGGMNTGSRRGTAGQGYLDMRYGGKAMRIALDAQEAQAALHRKQAEGWEYGQETDRIRAEASRTSADASLQGAETDHQKFLNNEDRNNMAGMLQAYRSGKTPEESQRNAYVFGIQQAMDSDGKVTSAEFEAINQIFEVGKRFNGGLPAFLEAGITEHDDLQSELAKIREEGRETKDPSWTSVNVQLPDGTVRSGRFDSTTGRAQFLDGSPVPEGAMFTSKGGGMEFEYTEGEGFRLRTGGTGSTVGSQTAAIDRVTNNTALLEKIQSIEELASPETLKEVLTIGGRLETLLDITEEVVFGELDPEEQARLTRVTQVMSRATQAYSQFLFGQGGKNLTKTEKQTVRGMLPQAGESWLDMDFDTRTAFVTKLNELKQITEKALVRDYIIATNTLFADLTPEEIDQRFPRDSDEYKRIRGMLFKEAGVEPTSFVSIEDMSEEELAIYIETMKAELGE